MNELTIAERLLSQLRRSTIEHAINTLSEEFERTDRTGGVLALAVFDPFMRQPIVNSVASITIGRPARVIPYAFYAYEKILRLYTRRREGFLDFAVPQSAYVSNSGGGCLVFNARIGASEFYLSFSGETSGALPEIDEAVVYILGEKLELISPMNYQNPFIARARELLQDVAL